MIVLTESHYLPGRHLPRGIVAVTIRFVNGNAVVQEIDALGRVAKHEVVPAQRAYDFLLQHTRLRVERPAPNLTGASRTMHPTHPLHPYRHGLPAVWGGRPIRE